MLTVSQNEVSTTVVKACRGAAADWGYAHDAGYLARYLAATDTPFLGSLLRVLENLDGTGEDPAGLALSQQKLYAPLCSLAITEWLTAGGSSWAGEVVALRYLLAALAVVTGREGHDLTIGINGDAGLHAVAARGVISGHGDIIDQHVVLEMINPAQSPFAGEPLMGTPVSGRPVQVSHQCWQRLSDYAYRTYVPETEHSRLAGAGAGDIDNE